MALALAAPFTTRRVPRSSRPSVLSARTSRIRLFQCNEPGRLGPCGCEGPKDVVIFGQGWTMFVFHSEFSHREFQPLQEIVEKAAEKGVRRRSLGIDSLRLQHLHGSARRLNASGRSNPCQSPRCSLAYAALQCHGLEVELVLPVDFVQSLGCGSKCRAIPRPEHFLLRLTRCESPTSSCQAR